MSSRRKSFRARNRLRAYRRIPDARAPAQSPGTLVHIGEKLAEAVTFDIVDYGADRLEERRGVSVETCLAPWPPGVIRWIRVVGLHEVEAIGRLLDGSGVHPLIQEDIFNTNHRPKIEAFDELLFITLKLIAEKPAAPGSFGEGDAIDADAANAGTRSVSSSGGFDPGVPSAREVPVRVDQVSLVVTPRLVISFEEGESSVFVPVRARLAASAGRMRRSGTDYLCWALLDAVVDHCFPVLDRMEAEMEAIDEDLRIDLTAEDLAHIHAVRREITHVYRLLRPLREVASSLLRADSAVLSRETELFYRDLYEHTIHAIEMCESLREESSSLRDYYASALGNRMNSIMKVLTAAATIFLPLTFLAGVYGMNFDVMPELRWRHGYFALWGVFVLVALGLVLFFRRRRWL